MSTSTALPMADSRDMYVIHSAFKREFPAAPALVRAVTPGDTAAVTRVADHVLLLTGVLNMHHTGEDKLVWPKLKERGPAEIEPLVETMEQQHEALHGGLEGVETRVTAWRSSGNPADQEAVAVALETMIPTMVEHMAAEEANLLPLIDKYLTHDEWAELGAEGMGNTPKSRLPIIFGMVLKDGEPEHIEAFKTLIPAPAWFLLSRLGPRAYARYARKLSS
jgi:iron-sulfur cluster repair protein YtfE (RIC family)